MMTDRTSLIDIIRETVTLTPYGRDRVIGVCPFCPTEAASLIIYPSQHFACQACGVAGDAFTWIMARDGVDFRTVLETLARLAGVTLATR